METEVIQPTSTEPAPPANSEPAPAEPSKPAEAAQPQRGFLLAYATGAGNNTRSAEPAGPDPLNIGAQRSRLLQMGFGADTPATDEVIRAASREMRRDPALWQSLQEYNGLAAQAAECEAAGDRMGWAEAVTGMAPLERKLRNAFDGFITARIGGHKR